MHVAFSSGISFMPIYSHSHEPDDGIEPSLLEYETSVFAIATNQAGRVEVSNLSSAKEKNKG